MKLIVFLILISFADCFQIHRMSSSQDGIVVDDSCFDILVFSTNTLLPRGIQMNSFFKSPQLSSWRGYFCDFEIQSNYLFIRGILIVRNVVSANGKSTIFYTNIVSELFTGKWPCPLSNYCGTFVIDARTNSVTCSIYGRVMIIDVKNGEVLRKRICNESEFVDYRNRKFLLYRNTPEYEKHLLDFSNSTLDRNAIDRIICKNMSEKYLPLLLSEE